MIELALKLFDYLVKLAETRESRNRRRFDAFVKPAYDAAEIIYKDYLSILLEVRKMLEIRTSIRDIVRFLEERRIEFKPLRMRLSSYLEARGVFSGTFADLERNDRKLQENLPDFERGILGLLRGGIELTDEGGSLRTYAVGKHTILDLIQHMGHIEPTNDEYYNMTLDVVKHTEDMLERAFSLITAGYSKEQSELP